MLSHWITLGECIQHAAASSSLLIPGASNQKNQKKIMTEKQIESELAYHASRERDLTFSA
jgi:uncharacterized HAD superfamily protein